MTSKARTITVSVSALLSAVIAVGGAAWGGIPKAVALADARYVRTDSFRALQAGEDRRRALDSVAAVAQYAEIRRLLAGLDSSDRCRRSQQAFCR